MYIKETEHCKHLFKKTDFVSNCITEIPKNKIPKYKIIHIIPIAHL